MVMSPKEQLRYLENKMKQNPNSILFARLADAYLENDRIDEALRLCEQGVKKHPYYVTGHYIMSKCYVKKKQFDHAEKELKRVLLFDPKYIAAHRDYGDLMEQIDWNNTCESSYEKIVEIDPLNVEAREKLDKIRAKIESQDDKEKNEELDMDLIDFEEAAVVPLDSTEIDEPEENKTKETFEEFEEAFLEKKEDDTDADEEDEKFSFILDDIFREEKDTDTITTETKPEIEHEETEPEIEHEIEPPVSEQEPQFSLEESTQNLDDVEQNEIEISTDINDKDEFEEISLSESIENDEKQEADTLADDEDFDELAETQQFEIQEAETEIEPEKDIPIDDFEEIEIEEDTEADEDADNFDDWLEEDQEIDQSSDYDTEFDKTVDLENEDDFSDRNGSDSEFDDDSEITEINLTETKEVIPEPIQNTTSEYDDELQYSEQKNEKKRDKIVTPTLGEIYTAQQQYAKAIGVYEILKKNDPDNLNYQQKIDYLKKKLEESKNDD